MEWYIDEPQSARHLPVYGYYFLGCHHRCPFGSIQQILEKDCPRGLEEVRWTSIEALLEPSRNTSAG